MQQTNTKLWTWQYILAISLTFLFYLSLQSLLGGFPVFVTQISHNPASGGIMTTAFMLAAVVTRPMIGMVMNKINMKKFLISAVGYIFFVILLSFISESVSVLVILRVLQGMGFGVISTLLATFMTNIIPDDRLGEGIGFFGMATSIGTTIGPMVALFFIHSYSFDMVLIFSLIIIVVVFAGGLLLKNQSTGEYTESEQKTSLLRSAFDIKAFIPCLLVMIFYITFTGNVNFLDGLGKSVGLGGKTSLFFFILMIMLILIRPFSGKIYDRMGHKFLLYPASICAVIGLILLANMQNLGTLIVASIFYGVAYGVMQPTLQAWAVRRVHPHNKATANAMALSFMDLGQSIGAVLLGLVAGKVGYSSMYGFSAILAALFILVYFVFNLRVRLVRNEANNMKSL